MGFRGFEREGVLRIRVLRRGFYGFGFGLNKTNLRLIFMRFLYFLIYRFWFRFFVFFYEFYRESGFIEEVVDERLGFSCIIFTVLVFGT